MTLLQAIKNTPDTTTLNGAPAYSTTGSALLDASFQLGAARNMSEENIIRYFEAAITENKNYAIRLLFYLRDAREGVGERRVFNVIMKHLANTRPTGIAEKIFRLIPEYGRWDDLLPLLDTKISNSVLSFISTALLKDENGLAAKWMPREKTSNLDNKRWASMLRQHMDLSPRQYRKLLVRLTNVVETQMCANNWSEIKYSSVPSVAHSRYRKAFIKHDSERYNLFTSKVIKGEAKINASVTTPYDILKPIFGGCDKYFTKVTEDVRNSIIAQWINQTNWLPSNSKILTISDMSGSMLTTSPGYRPIDVCVALTQYVSERLPEPWKNHFINFSDRPQLLEMRGNDPIARIMSMDTNNWGGSTNLQAVFDLILNTAKQNRLSQSDMPDTLLVLSDMQFNVGTYTKQTNFEVIKNKFTLAGYKMPSIVWWNLNSHSTFENKMNESGVIMLSGFSAASMQYLDKFDLTPLQALINILDTPRYNEINII